MKKTLSILFVILFISTTAFAQDNPDPRNSLKFGIGTSFLKPGNYFGSKTMHLQYEHTLFRPLRIAVDGFRINAELLENNGHERFTKAYQIDAGLNLALISNSTNALKIGGGISWQDADYKYTTAIERDSNDQIVSKLFNETQEESFGWTSTLEYEVYVVKHIVLGTRLTYKQYKNGDQNYFFGLNAGFRF